MSITSANAIFTLVIASVFPVPVQLQGFSADDIFSTDPLEAAQIQMGVDGILSGGFVYNEVKQSITLQADSKSNQLFDAWYAAQLVAQDVFEAQGFVNLKAISKKYAMARGFLTSYPPMPDGGKVLKPRKFGITWNSISPAIG